MCYAFCDNLNYFIIDVMGSEKISDTFMVDFGVFQKWDGKVWHSLLFGQIFASLHENLGISDFLFSWYFWIVQREVFSLK